MRWLTALVTAVIIGFSASASAFSFNSTYYGVYEGPCTWGGSLPCVYIVPKNSFLIIGVDQPTPIMFMPQTTGYEATIYADGSLGNFTLVNLTANNLPTGVASSSYKLFGGDFDANGAADLLLQGSGSRYSYVLATDTTGTPQNYYNFGTSLNAVSISAVDVDQNGRTDIVATDGSGNITTYLSNYAAGFDTNVPSYATLVGSINGKFRVDEVGNSTYTVDILSAAGTAGVAPHISLNYSSGAENGIAGIGWSVGGVSAISRCRQTLTQDNNATAITLGATDRFCLDGQRLILISGTYGASGSTYRTEIDSYALITAYGGTIGNPAYFTVVRKDSSTSTYGNGNGSQQVLGSAVLTWSISQFKDSVGNPIRFSYLNNPTGANPSTNEHLISRIDYGYGTDPGTTNNSSTYIQFTYQARPDIGGGYVAGFRIQNSQRLKTVRSYSNGVELRNYNLSYRAPDGIHTQSFVEKLTECVGVNCLSPTSFNWNLNNGGLSNTGTPVVSIASSKSVSMWLLDIDGDGKLDLVYRFNDTAYNMYYKLWRGNGYAAPVQFASGIAMSTNVQVIDYNNDGMQDLLIGVAPQNWKVYLGGSNGLSSQPIDTGVSPSGVTTAASVDIDSDGLSDFIWADTVQTLKYALMERTVAAGKWTYHYSATQRPLQYPPALPSGCNTTAALVAPGVDYNADGMMDMRVYANCSGSFQMSTLIAAPDHSFTSNGNWVDISPPGGFSLPFVATADFNGDGLMDQYYWAGVGSAASLKIRLNAGNGFGAPAPVGQESVMDYPTSFMDYNADGYTDLVYGLPANTYGPPVITNLMVRLYNPQTEAFGNPIATSLPFQEQSYTTGRDQNTFVDVNGDGHIDWLRVQNSSTTSAILLYMSSDTGVGNRIINIDNGMGSATTINYKPLTDTSVYTKGTDANDATKWTGAPVFDVIPSSYVVASVSTTAPAATATPAAVNYGSTSSVSYQYAGLKFQASGRGSLGFESIATTDMQTSIKSTTTYRQDFPYIGQPITTTIQSSTGLVFSSKQNVLASNALTGADGTKYYQVYVSQIIEQSKDPVSGAETSYRVSTSNVPDSWGNVTNTSLSTFASNDHTNFLTRTTTVKNYGVSAYDLQFGRLNTSTVTLQRAGLSDIVRTSSFTYYGSGDGALRGLVKTKNVQGNDGVAAATVSYQYDAFGNQRRITSSANGLADRYVNTTYDAAGRFVASKSSTYKVGGIWVEQLTESIAATDRNAYGAPTKVQALNGFVTNYSYDVLGRESSRSDSSGAGFTTTFYRGGIVGAQYYVVTRANTGATTTQYFDALGRSIAKQQLGFDGSTLSSETEYDNVGRVKRQSASHIIGAQVYWTTNNYDAFRLQNQQVPATNNSIAPTVFAYNGLTTVITNALNQTRTEIRNAAGELIEVDDYLGGKITYTYDAAGQLITTSTWGMQAGAGVTINTYLDYDTLGRKVKMRDTDKGTWFYAYNAFGDLTDQYKVMSVSNYVGTLAAAIADTNVKLQHTHMDYDQRGRLIARADYRETRPLDSVLEGSAGWTYDTAINGIGQVAQESGGGLTRTYSYDAIGRPASTLHNDGYGSYVMAVSYDGYGRAYKQYDALNSSSGTQTTYNSYGYPAYTTDLATGLTLWQVLTMDARGNVTSAALSNGATASWSYDGGSDLLLAQTANVGAVNLQNLTYVWDLLGNQKSRQDRGNGKNLQQAFCYDGLNRLTKTNEGTLADSCTGMTAAQQDQEYDGFGDITRKNNVGTYTYNTARPHQLQSSSDGVSYTYDNVGNLTSDTSNRVLNYTVFDKPSSITKLTNQITFSYGADRNYYKRVDTNGTSTTTYYIGDVEKVVKSDGSYDVKRYLPGGGLWTYHFSSAGVQTSLDKQTMLKDVLGSVTMITDGVGAIKQSLAYNAWGERANTADWKTVLPATAFLPVSQQFTAHGYTGQEMLDAVGLIHYGGRIYDARLGRFVQADPLVPGVTNTQSFNRYAYVENKPLSATDPRGYETSDILDGGTVNVPQYPAYNPYWNISLGSLVYSGFITFKLDLNITFNRQGVSGAAFSNTQNDASNSDSDNAKNDPKRSNMSGEGFWEPSYWTTDDKGKPIEGVNAYGSRKSNLPTGATLMFIRVSSLGEQLGLLSFGAVRYLGQLNPIALATTLFVISNPGENDEESWNEIHRQYNESADADSGSSSDEGCIYCVKGDKTSSGKDYVGSTDNMGQRQKDKSDGRDRSGAEVVDKYTKGDRDSRRTKEQQAINNRGGVDKLDNKRNEVAPSKWSDKGITPP